jgi:hypothetical protein
MIFFPNLVEEKQLTEKNIFRQNGEMPEMGT